MWIVTVLAMCVPMVGCMEANADHPVFDTVPAATQEACYIQAYDVVVKEQRRNGTHHWFDIACELAGA